MEKEQGTRTVRTKIHQLQYRPLRLVACLLAFTALPGAVIA